jgi:uncharacterized protein YebE (UPF0316 family)
MIKILIILIAGIIETYCYTWYLISVENRQLYISSILNTLFMILYLGIIAWAIKDTNTWLMIIIYSIACGIGNFLKLLQEKKNEKKKK